jgi:hypothetical protein
MPMDNTLASASSASLASSARKRPGDRHDPTRRQCSVRKMTIPHPDTTGIYEFN